jgi:beta-glucosidase
MLDHDIVYAVLATLAVAGVAVAQNAEPPAAGAGGTGGGGAAPWRNTSLPVDVRARDLLRQLTLEEKISLVHADQTFSTPGLPRFNIGRLWTSDGPQGVREEINPYGWNAAGRTDDFATALPANIGLAATFDADLGRAYGNVIGEEALARGKHIMLCPGMNIMRTPLNGRNSEYLGEDPFLAGRMAVGFIQGLQANGVAACAKHYALNDQETNRSSVNVTVDERTMREIYLPAFKASVVEGKAWTVMTGYNRVNGSYCAENEFLLRQVLKGDWDFQGIAMSDWGGTHSTVASAKNGLDLEMGTNVNAGRGGPDPHDRDFFAAPLLAAVKSGDVPMTVLDDMALRNLRVMAAVGLLDHEPQRPMKPGLMAPEHLEVARRVAEAACVLLKNEGGVLPLEAGRVKSIAVIGDNATAKFASFGDSARIKTKYEVTPLEGLQQRAGDGIKVTYAQGYARTGRGAPATAPAAAADLVGQAVAAAKEADVAIVIAGLYRPQDQEGADRPNMNLPPGQAELIQAVVAANPRTIVVLNGGSPSVVEPWIGGAAGLVMYWYGGTEGGHALARVLFGDVNPSGKLPCTWPKQLADSPAHAAGTSQSYPGTGMSGRGPLTPESGPQQTYGEGIFVGYRWFDEKKIEPQFPFGFGLSYTTFSFEDLTVEPAEADSGALTNVRVTVANTGSREGATVVQLYVGQNAPKLPRPPRELKGFAKVTLKPGERRMVRIPVDAGSFAYWDGGRKAWVADAGEYTVFVGDSSRNLPLNVKYTLGGERVVREGK